MQNNITINLRYNHGEIIIERQILRVCEDANEKYDYISSFVTALLRDGAVEELA